MASDPISIFSKAPQGAFWNKQVETLDEGQIRRLQMPKIRAQLKRAYEKSSFYRAKMDGFGVAPGDVRSWEDFRALPIFMTNEEHKAQQEQSLAEDGHVFGKILCAPLDDVIAMGATSGTTGQPSFYGFTRRDLAIANEILARAFWRMGIRPGDCVIHGFGLSMWVQGIAPVRALEAMGVRCVPVGAEGGTERFLNFARLTRPSALLCTPSYAQYLAEQAPELMGFEVGELGIERIFCGGEPGAGMPAICATIEAAWGARVYDFAGTPWGIGAISCAHETYQGMHLISEDCSLNYDLVDPQTLKPIPIEDGAIGAAVITSFDWDAAPPIKFLNSDLMQIFTEPCPCGLPGKRRKILGRMDDLLIIRGINVYPAAVKNLIAGFQPEVSGEIRILLNDPPPRIPAPLRIRLERGKDLGAGDEAALSERIRGRIRGMLKFSAQLEFVEPGSLARSTHKGKLIEKLYEEP